MLRRSVALIGNGACAAVIGLTLIAFFCSSANAQQPFGKGCLAVSKIEYNSAKRKKMLHSKLGTYMRTGPFWRRSYWYCVW